MKLVSVVGARPQFVKVWPIAAAVERANRRGDAIEHVIVHTGQHYSAAMSARIFDELTIPGPTVNLGVGSGPHGSQTGAMMAAIEAVLAEAAPDGVLVYGDTNSTLAAALAAAKLGIPIAHLEAGLRSGDRRMPEEVNRIVADHVSDLLLAPTEHAVSNLRRENLAGRAVRVGDVMYDAWTMSADLRAPHREDVLRRHRVEPERFALATVHRAGNTGERLDSIMDGLAALADGGLPVLFPVHPRTASALARAARRPLPPLLRLIEPVGYLEMSSLLEHARVTVTDSGGLQKEAFFAGCPCVTVRAETEWTETVQAGANVLVGDDPDRIVAAVRQWERLAPGRSWLAQLAADCYGGGAAAERSLAAIGGLCGNRRVAETCDAVSR